MKEFTEVRSKKKARKETILPKPYPTADRLIIFSLATAPNNRKEATDRALQVVNKAITTHADIERPPLILANITATNNLVFTVAPQYLSTIYEPYLAILEEALHEFPITSSRVSQRWTRFIINSIHTTATPETVRTEIETNYSTFRMGQTPRCLTSPERRQGKEASSMIVTFLGEMSKKSLGATSLAMLNRECTIAEYITFGPTTQCNKCQTYGHPTQRCTASNHTCAVCAQPRPTKDHPYTIANCRAGHSCNHPPISCANCLQPHKATDRNCSTYVKTTLGMCCDNAATADTMMCRSSWFLMEEQERQDRWIPASHRDCRLHRSFLSHTCQASLMRWRQRSQASTDYPSSMISAGGQKGRMMRRLRGSSQRQRRPRRNGQQGAVSPSTMTKRKRH